jgi:hypothetical protein
VARALGIEPYRRRPGVSSSELAPAEKTYRAIGRFMFEFSQAEYTIRHYLAEEIGLGEEHFAPVIESYDTGVLCTVAIEVFLKSRGPEEGKRIRELINGFRNLSLERNRVAHSLWVPFKEGGTAHYTPRHNLKPTMAPNQAEQLESKADAARELSAKLERAFLRAQ